MSVENKIVIFILKVLCALLWAFGAGFFLLYGLDAYSGQNESHVVGYFMVMWVFVWKLMQIKREE